MPEEMLFDFHEKFLLKITRHGKSRFDDYLENGIYYFRSQKPDRVPDLEIEIGKFNPRLQDCFFLDEKFAAKEKYVFGADSYKLGKWKYDFSFSEKPFRARVESNSLGYLFFPAHVNDVLINILLNMRQCPTIHASCVEKNGNAIVFPARSAAGKTITALRFIEKGYNIMSDNFTILNKGNALCFPASFNLFYYNLMPVIKKRLSKKILSAISARKLLYKLSFGYAKLLQPVKISDVFSGSITEKARAECFAMLLNSRNGKFSIREAPDRRSFVKRMVYSNMFESFSFIKAMTEHSYLFPNGILSNHWELLEKNLLRETKGKQLLEVELPLHYSQGDFQKFFEKIDGRFS